MVEEGDGFVELAGGKVPEQALELAEGAAHLPQAIQAVRLQKAEAIDIAVGAPTAARLIAKEQAAVAGGHETQHAVLAGHAHGGKAALDVLADAAGVLHHLFRMTEGLRAQLLQYVAAAAAGRTSDIQVRLTWPAPISSASVSRPGKRNPCRGRAQFFGEHAVFLPVRH